MSYCLINGTRYYKDDRTGRVSVDNVSQEEADRRARQKSAGPVFQGSGGQRIVRQSTPSNRAAVGGGTRSGTAVSSAAGSRSFPWVVVVVVVVAAAILGAVYYNRTHVSNTEQAIDNYMQQETAAAQEYNSEAEETSVETSADSETVALQAYSS